MTCVPPEERAGPRTPGPDAPAGTPRWLFVLGVCIAVVVIVGIVVAHLTGAIGPGAH